MSLQSRLHKYGFMQFFFKSGYEFLPLRTDCPLIGDWRIHHISIIGFCGSVQDGKYGPKFRHEMCA